MPADIPFDAKGNLAEPIQTMVVSKSSINRFRGTAQDENLFSMEVMATPTVFEGTISGRFDQAELERLIHNGSCIGGYQTAGYGRCSIEVIEKTIFVDDRNQLRTRIHKCGQKIPVTLLSDAMVALE